MYHAPKWSTHFIAPTWSDTRWFLQCFWSLWDIIYQKVNSASSEYAKILNFNFKQDVENSFSILVFQWSLQCYLLFCYISSTAWKVSVFGVILVRLRSECGKIRTRITLNTDTFFSILAAFHTRWGSWKILKMISIAWCVSFWEAAKSVQDMMAVANLPVVENACSCYAVQKKN